MQIKSLNKNFKMPVKSTAHSGAYDLFMPTSGYLIPNKDEGFFYPLGFSAAVPKNYVALLLPRSGVGAKHGISLGNTVGVIDSDYRGEWVACLRNNSNKDYSWSIHARILQMLIVPVAHVHFEYVAELTDTDRGEGGFGSTGT